MRRQQPVVHVRTVATEFGEQVDLADVADAGVQAQLDVLRREGYRSVRVARGSTADLALAVMPGAPTCPDAGPHFDAVVLCTEAIEGQAPADWVAEFRLAAGLSSAPVFMVTGAACTNFVLGLDAARGLIASGVADDVLLLLVDRWLTGSRFTPISRSLYSDAAVSCLVSARPSDGSFRLLGTAMEIRLIRDGEWNELAEARGTVLALSRAAERAAGERPAEQFDHLLTLNLGETARRLLSMSTRVPSDRMFTGPVEEIAHCYAADIPVNLEALQRSGTMGANAHVLALASSRGCLGAVALAHGPGTTE